MSSSIEISDDDDSFVQPQHSGQLDVSEYQDKVSLDSDNEPVENESVEVLSVSSTTDNNYTSDDEELPAVNVTSKRSAAIKNLFPQACNFDKPKPLTSKVINKEVKKQMPSITQVPQEPKVPGFDRMIGGVKVNLPVEPYGSQIALMSKVITAINKGQNCLLESPTGSGKTLALLCAALAWQQQERNRLAQNQAQQYFSNHPELSGVNGVVDYIASPQKKDVTPEKLFGKTVFGEKSIYDRPVQNGSGDGSNKRQEPLPCCEVSPTPAQVTIHKKRKLDGSEFGECSKTTSPQLPSTPEKTIPPPQPETPQNIRLPTIYYGARTHKQIQQVVKEFSRTLYCGESLMTLLASRDYACVREFDKQMWGTKNDMCKGCTKTYTPKDSNVPKSNCEFFDNRQALNHKSLPPAFDLEDLVTAGQEIIACPYYAARAMAATANIVFCPYNYLIEPGIRSSMQIDLHDNIVVIDEAHNIEDICRDAASFSFTRDNVGAVLKELQGLAESRYANQDVMSYIEKLVNVMRNWDDWFVNQLPLVNNKPLNNNEAVFTWQVDDFVQSLNNHNIGLQHYHEFRESAEIFVRRYRESPETLYGITQATGNLIESMDTVLGYLFRESGKYMDDYTPALVRTVYGNMDSYDATSWRNSQFNRSIEKETLSLRMLCMNPGVVFAGLKTAKCILLASGTLTPLVSLHSELATEFPLQVSPNHVIPRDRVWIGTLTTCPNGRPLECKSRDTDQPDIQDGIGQAILWVSQVTPNGVLCFLPSYMLMNKLQKRWRETGLWQKLNDLKHVFTESRNVRDHNDIMEGYYNYVTTSKGALLFAVYRGKVSEGMDFKDHQARAVITVGVPYPNTFDMAVKEKMKYNDKYAAKRSLLSSREWLRVQAYRALNQAVGRCVRHRGDWGAVLLIDSRFTSTYYTEHLSKWVRNFLGNNHNSYERLVNSPDSLESFMQNMTIRQNEEV